MRCISFFSLFFLVVGCGSNIPTSDLSTGSRSDTSIQILNHSFKEAKGTVGKALIVKALIQNKSRHNIEISILSFSLETKNGIVFQSDGLETEYLADNCNADIEIKPNISYQCNVAFTGKNLSPKKLIYSNKLLQTAIAYF